MDLTHPEIKALLWCAHTVDVAYGHGPPEGSTIKSAVDKLNAELRKHEALAQLGLRPRQPEVVHQGTGWDR